MSECEVKFEFCCTPFRVHVAKVRGTLSPPHIPWWRCPCRGSSYYATALQGWKVSSLPSHFGQQTMHYQNYLREVQVLFSICWIVSPLWQVWQINYKFAWKSKLKLHAKDKTIQWTVLVICDATVKSQRWQAWSMTKQTDEQTENDTMTAYTTSLAYSVML